jgi:hypothetical protein
MKDNEDPNLRALDHLTHEAGLAAMSDDSATTADDDRWAHDVMTSAQERIAALRRGLLPARPTIRRINSLRPGLLALSRDALIAMIERISVDNGANVQFAHRNLDTLTDNDLRYLLQALDSSDEAE